MKQDVATSRTNPATSVTTDPTDPRLAHGHDEKPRPQADVYLILSAEERARGFVRPVRASYTHRVCGATTTMGKTIAETFARDQKFYAGTYCVVCQRHRPVAEFTWPDGTPVGS